MNKPLIRDFNHVDPTALEDLILVMAKNMEHALMQGGAVPGKDYTILDCYKLAQPFALSVFKSSDKITFSTEHGIP